MPKKIYDHVFDSLHNDVAKVVCSFKIQKNKKIEFERICKENKISVSHALSRAVDFLIEEYNNKGLK